MVSRQCVSRAMLALGVESEQLCPAGEGPEKLYLAAGVFGQSFNPCLQSGVGGHDIVTNGQLRKKT